MSMAFMCTMRYMAKGVSLFGVCLMHIAINIQRWIGEWYKIFVVPHSSEVSASSCIQVKIFCFTFAFVNRDHGSEWIRTFVTLVYSLWHLVLYVAFITQRCLFVFTIYIYIFALPRVMKHYSPTGRRNHGRPFNRLLDTWDRNGSTSAPTPRDT